MYPCYILLCAFYILCYLFVSSCLIVYLSKVCFTGNFIKYSFGAVDHLKVLCVGLFY